MPSSKDHFLFASVKGMKKKENNNKQTKHLQIFPFIVEFHFEFGFFLFSILLLLMSDYYYYD